MTVDEDGVHRGAAPEEEDPWVAQEALKQLAELGYIEGPGKTWPKPNAVHWKLAIVIWPRFITPPAGFLKRLHCCVICRNAARIQVILVAKLMCRLAMGQSEEAEAIPALS